MLLAPFICAPSFFIIGREVRFPVSEITEGRARKVKLPSLVVSKRPQVQFHLKLQSGKTIRWVEMPQIP